MIGWWGLASIGSGTQFFFLRPVVSPMSRRGNFQVLSSISRTENLSSRSPAQNVYMQDITLKSLLADIRLRDLRWLQPYETVERKRVIILFFLLFFQLRACVRVSGCRNL